MIKKRMKSETKVIGSISVDSGQLLLIDPNAVKSFQNVKDADFQCFKKSFEYGKAFGMDYGIAPGQYWIKGVFRDGKLSEIRLRWR